MRKFWNEREKRGDQPPSQEDGRECNPKHSGGDEVAARLPLNWAKREKDRLDARAG